MAKVLFDEIDQILSNDPESITFIVPDPKTIQRNLDNLEYEKRRNRKKKARGLTTQLKQILAELDDPSFKKEVLGQLQSDENKD